MTTTVHDVHTHPRPALEENRPAPPGTSVSPEPLPDENLHAVRARLLTVAVEHDERAVVLVVAGEMDMLTAPRVSHALENALRDRPQLIVVDLSQVKFLASTGLSVLLDGHQQAAEHTPLRVVANARATLRPIQITGLHEHLAIYASREEALAEH